MRIVLMGPPGVGKGTQAGGIAQRFSIPAIATGDMLRAAVEAGTEVGKRAQEYMLRGDLVPDEVIIACVAERLAMPDAQRGFLLDGFPRTVPQAEALDRLLEDLGLTLDAVIALEADEEVIVERLSGRLTCPNCGAIFHAKSNPPKAEGVCDSCGSNLTVRDDDEPEAIRNRLRVYSEKTAPLKGYYNGSGRLKSVDGAGAPSAVAAGIASALGCP
jgi:adenylate kinase